MALHLGLRCQGVLAEAKKDLELDWLLSLQKIALRKKLGKDEGKSENLKL
jgi:hypothetical protein